MLACLLCANSDRTQRSKIRAYSTSWSAFRGTDITEFLTGSRASLCLDVGGPDHLGPFLSFVGDELAKIGGREREPGAAHVRKPRLQLRVRQGRVDVFVGFLDRPGRLGPCCAYA